MHIIEHTNRHNNMINHMHNLQNLVSRMLIIIYNSKHIQYNNTEIFA